MVAFQVRLVDDEDIRDLEDAGLDHLHAIAQVRGQHHDGGIRDSRHLQLRLPHADRLDDDGVEAEGTQQADGLVPAQIDSAHHARNPSPRNPLADSLEV